MRFRGVTLGISDDGLGFDARSEFSGHLGLRSMHERASSLGETLESKTAPEKGPKSVRAYRFDAPTHDLNSTTIR